jgi:uncharacterized membrane protein YesL
MSLLWTIMRKTFSDIWSESFLFILFNVLWVGGSAPGFLLIAYGAISRTLIFIFTGIMALFPWPFLTFALFRMAYEAGEARAIGFRMFFTEGRNNLRQAYKWAAVNLIIMPILLTNITFYSNPDSPLGDTTIGTVISSLFMSITMFWLIVQLFVLTMYPRLERPGVRDALRQAVQIIGRWPVPVLFVAFLAMSFGLISIFVPILPLLITFSFIAVMANRATAEILIAEERQSSIPGKEA